jgi:hypothetical protein
MNEPHIDITRLEKVRVVGHKTIARCPACAENGGDRRGDHLAIMQTGKFACAAMPGDKEHRRRIFALAGIPGDREQDPELKRLWQERTARERSKERDRQRLVESAAEYRAGIVDRHSWNIADAWEDSPQRIDCPLVEFDPRHVLATLFPPDALLWTGNPYQSGAEYANRWKTCAEWQTQPIHELGPMVAPATWEAGTVSRAAGNVMAAPFTVLDFDGFDGVKPATAVEIEEHILASLALIRWMREALCWRLAALIHTGNKSLHAWFHTPPQGALASLRDTASAFGVDAGLIGRPEHPCRLPGQRHPKTGNPSSVLWLQCPEA